MELLAETGPPPLVQAPFTHLCDFALLKGHSFYAADYPETRMGEPLFPSLSVTPSLVVVFLSSAADSLPSSHQLGACRAMAKRISLVAREGKGVEARDVLTKLQVR